MSKSNRLLTVPSAGSYSLPSLFKGTEIGGFLSPSTTSGMSVSTAGWNSDTAWWGTDGDICSTNSSGGILSTGNNGADHWQNMFVGTSKGLYLSGHITGFVFKASQDSGAGHGMYIKRVGFRMVRLNSASSIFCDCKGDLGRGDYGTKTYDVTFTSAQQSKLNSGDYCFERLAYQLSTEGGKGSRTTSLRSYDFKFKYIGKSGKALLLPMLRVYGDRHRQDRFAD